MTRLLLPILAILTSLHRFPSLVSFTPPRTFGISRTLSSAGALGAARKEADNKKELDGEDAYVPAPWEDELCTLMNKRRLEEAWVNRMIKSKTRFFSYKKCR